jgi:hypothetical protein
VAEYAKSDEGGTGEDRGQEDMQSSDKWSRLPSEDLCSLGSTESGMFFFEICGRSVFLCTCVQLTIKHEPFNKQLGVKMRGTSFSCGNFNGHHNTELRT